MKRTGLCAVYVGNILALLRLHPAILERVEKLEPGGTGAEVTERWLRPIARLPHAEQLVAVAARLNVAPLSVLSGANAKKNGKRRAPRSRCRGRLALAARRGARVARQEY